MFTDPIFRLALTVSFLAHLAVIAPWALFPSNKDSFCEKEVELNYIVIESPSLATEEEIYTDTFQGEDQAEAQDTPTADYQFLTTNTESREQRTAFLKYYNLIREKVRAEIYSRREKGQKGKATVVFLLDPDGRLREMKCVALDASPAIKQKVLQGIKKAAPYPPFPKEIGSRPLRFSLTIRFTSE